MECRAVLETNTRLMGIMSSSVGWCHWPPAYALHCLLVVAPEQIANEASAKAGEHIRCGSTEQAPGSICSCGASYGGTSRHSTQQTQPCPLRKTRGGWVQVPAACEHTEVQSPVCQAHRILPSKCYTAPGLRCLGRLTLGPHRPCHPCVPAGQQAVVQPAHANPHLCSGCVKGVM